MGAIPSTTRVRLSLLRAAETQRVVLAILGLKVVVAAAKAAYGLWSGSLAVTSDALHSMLDASSNVVGFLALRFAADPPDSDHPYGHRKIEILAACLIGLFIAAGSTRFAWSAVDALMSHRPPPTIAASGFAVMLGTLVINIGVARYELRRGRELQSPFLVADAAHTSSDIIVSIAVLLSMLATKMGLSWADPAAALGVLGVVLLIAWRILSSNVSVLLDRAVVDAARVREAALSVVGVVDCHRVRSRGLEGAIHLDLHVLVNGELSLRQAHEISHAVEETLKHRFPGVGDITIHVEPEGEPEEGL